MFDTIPKNIPPEVTSEIATLRASLAAAEKRAGEAEAHNAELLESLDSLGKAAGRNAARVAALEAELKDAAIIIDQMNANAQGNDKPDVKDPLTYAVAMAAIERIRSLLRPEAARAVCSTCGGSEKVIRTSYPRVVHEPCPACSGAKEG